MAFELDQVIPWGRNLLEYRKMFALEDSFGSQRILGCADGPASFNAEANAKGWNVTSFDPIYQFSKKKISDRIHEVKDEVMVQTRANKHQFRWDFFPNPDALCEVRLGAMKQFLEDFELGLAEQRYVSGVLPDLPFETNTFDLTLVSHFLFLYSHILDLDFHLQSIREMLRVSHEVRIFPLLDLSATRSLSVSQVIESLEKEFSVELQTVDYEFQIGGNQMMVLNNK